LFKRWLTLLNQVCSVPGKHLSGFGKITMLKSHVQCVRLSDPARRAVTDMLCRYVDAGAIVQQVCDDVAMPVLDCEMQRRRHELLLARDPVPASCANVTAAPNNVEICP
jgi:hypothetical protein